jgi:hypothetical protein
VAIIFEWLSFDAPIARGYGSMTVMQSSIRTVRNAQKQYGLRVREIMVEITRVSEALAKGSAPPPTHTDKFEVKANV